MTSLVLEGGTFRPIFSCGVMDALLDAEIMLPYIIGVSAGITDGFSYASRQKGRNLEILMRYRNDPRYLSMRNMVTDHSPFGIRFVFQAIPNELIPFDYTTFQQYPGQFWVGVTNLHTGEAEYLDGKKIDAQNTLCQATCSIPGVFPSCHYEGKVYYDGGIADSIPIQKAIDDGNRRHLIVLTQPLGYQKKLQKGNRVMARIMKHHYPAFSQKLLDRHLRYNATLAQIARLEEEGKAIVLRPSHPLNSFESDLATLKNSYQEGYDLAMARMDKIRHLLTEDD